MIGFSSGEQGVIRGMMERFLGDGHALDELVRIERAEMPGYNGKVVPRPMACGGFEVTMYLACCAPFTVAHELAHIADIQVRRQETRDHLSLAMPNHWHLAHRMTSEYIANRMACGYVDEPGVFAAFQSDNVGLAKAARTGDWAEAMIYYSLILGLFHGLGRRDCDPTRLLSPGIQLPEAVADGMASFNANAERMFEETWDRKLALA